MAAHERMQDLQKWIVGMIFAKIFLVAATAALGDDVAASAPPAKINKFALIWKGRQLDSSDQGCQRTDTEGVCIILGNSCGFRKRRHIVVAVSLGLTSRR